MAELIKQLYKKNDSTTKIFPNIKSENIPSLSVSLAKLTSDIQTTLNDVSSKLDKSSFNQLLSAITSACESYGLNFSYTFDGTNYSVSLTDILYDRTSITIESQYVSNFFCSMTRHGHHIVGRCEFAIEDQTSSNEHLLTINEQELLPSSDVYCVGIKNGNLCVFKVDVDGLVYAVNNSLQEFDVIQIIFDWWTN